MKNTTITIITAMILVTASIGTFFMEMITKDVLAGAMFSILLPCYMLFSFQKWSNENANELTAKAIAQAEADDHMVTLEKVGQMTEAAMMKQTGSSVEVQRSFVSV